eukprot:TRINITY_DN30861_c0_g1_i1.p1 TRINITY_DN30861_c0_g1~~TRINITY_DN30861_c0_g1_i1.p1  ORF type:complete len:391 (+),score=61.92 TRINITY_DN30861_c0_g1_i1:101-1273(+)
MQIQPTFYDFAIELAKKDTIIQQQQVRIEELQAELRSLRKKLEQARAENIAAERPNQQQTRYWTCDEHKRFLEALAKYGAKDVKSIAAYVGSRNPTQVRTHAQKYFLKMQGKQDALKNGDDESRVASVGYGENGGHQLVRSESLDNPSADPALQAGEPRRGSRKRAPEPVVDVNDSMSKRSPESPTSDSEPEDDGFGGAGAFGPDASRYVAQQISCVGESVICALKGLTPMEYVLFLKGLLENAEVHDLGAKCRNIQQTYLQRFTVDDVQHCYLLLVNITKAKSQPPPVSDMAPLGSPTDFTRAGQAGSIRQQQNVPLMPSSQAAQTASIAQLSAAPHSPAQRTQEGAGDSCEFTPVAPKDPFTNIDAIQREAERQAMAGLSDLASLCQQ